jgi:putative FmdB family regulatory protein
MPLYEYECDTCHHRFEVIQKFSDPQVEKCPSCGATVHKLQSAPAIQFKGAGFYITDYAKKEYTAATKADSDGASSDASTGSKDGGKDGRKETGSKEAGSKEAGSKEGGKGKTEKSVTSDKSASTSDSTPSSSSAAATTPKE